MPKLVGQEILHVSVDQVIVSKISHHIVVLLFEDRYLAKLFVVDFVKLLIGEVSIQTVIL
jgi:hypothetical protein